MTRMKHAALARNCEEALSFQFFLHAFIAASKEVMELEVLYEQLPKAKNSPRKERGVRQKLKHHLENLVGSCSRPLFPWSSESGALCKLLRYAESEGPLQKRVEKALGAAEGLASLFTEEAGLRGKAFAAAFSSGLDALLEHLEKLSRKLPSAIAKYKGSENLLFFLLRYKEELDLIFWDDFTKELFQKSFGTKEKAAAFITKRYSKRGFNQLLPVISAKMSEL